MHLTVGVESGDGRSAVMHLQVVACVRITVQPTANPASHITSRHISSHDITSHHHTSHHTNMRTYRNARSACKCGSLHAICTKNGTASCVGAAPTTALAAADAAPAEAADAGAEAAAEGEAETEAEAAEGEGGTSNLPSRSNNCHSTKPITSITPHTSLHSHFVTPLPLTPHHTMSCLPVLPMIDPPSPAITLSPTPDSTFACCALPKCGLARLMNSALVVRAHSVRVSGDGGRAGAEALRRVMVGGGGSTESRYAK
jgi:hypothetical protein